MDSRLMKSLKGPPPFSSSASALVAAGTHTPEINAMHMHLVSGDHPHSGYHRYAHASDAIGSYENIFHCMCCHQRLATSDTACDNPHRMSYVCTRRRTMRTIPNFPLQYWRVSSRYITNQQSCEAIRRLPVCCCPCCLHT